MCCLQRQRYAEESKRQRRGSISKIEKYKLNHSPWVVSTSEGYKGFKVRKTLRSITFDSGRLDPWSTITTASPACTKSCASSDFPFIPHTTTPFPFLNPGNSVGFRTLAPQPDWTLSARPWAPQPYLLYRSSNPQEIRAPFFRTPGLLKILAFCLAFWAFTDEQHEDSDTENVPPERKQDAINPAHR